MTQPLNYTPKAIDQLSAIPWPGMPGAATATRYLVEKLRQAQVFVVGDHGELLDRSKPRPEVPGVVFRPPFDVVALEYTAQAMRRDDPFYCAARSSRRIALAWDWADDLPREFGRHPDLGAGVVIASIAFIDKTQMWMPMLGAMHMAYEGEWVPATSFVSPFRDAMQASGSLARDPAKDRSYPMTCIPLMFEMCLHAERALGSQAAVMNTIVADTSDEVNAYTDLCYALACKNVSTRIHLAPSALNRSRERSGKPPLKDFHVLELSGGGDMPGSGGGADRSAARSHLRRGHIRRLAGDRVTWVNSTVVRGRGHVDKVYAL